MKESEHLERRRIEAEMIAKDMPWVRRSISMFEDLAALNERPAPFSVYTADILWTDPHISARMLDFHLNAEGDLASRRAVQSHRCLHGG